MSDENIKNFTEAWGKIDFAKVKYAEFIDIEEFKAELIEDIKENPKKNYSSYIMAKLKNYTPKPKMYVFKSHRPCTKVVQPQKKVTMPDGLGGVKSDVCVSIKCKFDFCVFTLTEEFAKNHGRSIDDVYKMIVAYPDYDKDFICISGPGIKVDKAKLAKFNTKPKEPNKVTQGAI